MGMAAGWVYPFIPKTDMLTENKSGLTDSCRHFHTYTHTHIAGLLRILQIHQQIYI